MFDIRHFLYNIKDESTIFPLYTLCINLSSLLYSSASNHFTIFTISLISNFFHTANSYLLLLLLLFPVFLHYACSKSVTGLKIISSLQSRVIKLNEETTQIFLVSYADSVYLNITIVVYTCTAYTDATNIFQKMIRSAIRDDTLCALLYWVGN